MLMQCLKCRKKKEKKKTENKTQGLQRKIKES